MNTNYLKYIIILIAFPLFFEACSGDDDLRSKELKVYLNEGSYPDNSLDLYYLHTPISTVGKTSVKFPIRITRPTSANVEVSLQVDNSLVTVYNETRDKEYKELSSEFYSISGNVTIQNGKMNSDSVTIEIKQKEKLTDKSGYILPIKISHISSNDKGVEISTNLNSLYIIITSSYSYIDENNTDVGGVAMNRDTWKTHVSDFYFNFIGENAFDGNISTGWFSPTYDRVPYVEIDMGAEQAVKGFRLTSFYPYGSGYAPSKIQIFTSKNGNDWEDIGNKNISYPAAGTGSWNPDVKPINFYAPISARYFKLSITGSYDSYMGIAEINAVK